MATTHATLRDDHGRCVPAGRRHTVHYEDLAADRGGMLARVWKSCGLWRDEETLGDVPARLTNMNSK